MNDNHALIIGRHILEQYEKWSENPMGKYVAIPIKLPHQSDQPPWCMTITADCPWFIETYIEDGEYKTKHWTMRDWYKKGLKGKVKL